MTGSPRRPVAVGRAGLRKAGLRRARGTIAGAVATVSIATGCSAEVGAGPPPSTRSSPVAGSLRENGVAVTLRWVTTNAQNPVLSAEFTPTRAGFHLYSIDLPEAGMDGIGRPTTLQVSGALTAVGPATADAAPVSLHLDGVADPLPVYPDGPVTLRQPVRVGPSGAGEVLVTYAACSRAACLPPVSRQRVEVTLPRSS